MVSIVDAVKNGVRELSRAMGEISVQASVLVGVADQLDSPCGPTAIQLRSGFGTQFPTNYYPHSIDFYEGYIYLTTVGVDNLSPPPYVSGDTKLQKIDPGTGVVVASCNGGAYKQPGLGNGYNGFCIHNGKAYVTNNHHIAGTADVVIIDLTTMSIESTIPLGTGAARHCVHDGTKIWVTLAGPDVVKRIDLTTNAVDLTISTPGKPFRLDYVFGSVWVCLFDSHQVKRLNPVDGSVQATIATGAAPNWFDHDENHVYIAIYIGNAVQRIDPTNNNISTLCTLSGDYPHHAMPLYNELWVACSGSHKIKIFDKSTGVLKQTKAVGNNPPSMCFDGTSVWHGCGNIGVIQRHLVEIMPSA